MARLDVAGIGLLVTGTVSAMLVLSWAGGTCVWSSTPIIGLAAVAVVTTLLLLVSSEQRAT